MTCTSPAPLQSAVKTLEENPDASLVYGDVLSIDANGNPFNLMTYGDWDLEGPDVFQYHWTTGGVHAPVRPDESRFS